jgi:hypothetical protein
MAVAYITEPLKHAMVAHSRLAKWNPKVHIFRHRVKGREWIYIARCGQPIRNPLMWQQHMMIASSAPNFCERCARKEGLGERSIRQMFQYAHAEQNREVDTLLQERTQKLLVRAKAELDEIWRAMTQLGWPTDIVGEPSQYVETTAPSGRVYIVRVK